MLCNVNIVAAECSAFPRLLIKTVTRLAQCCGAADHCTGVAQVWIRDVREAVELLDEATGQRTPKEQVSLSSALLVSIQRRPRAVQESMLPAVYRSTVPQASMWLIVDSSASCLRCSCCTTGALESSPTWSSRGAHPSTCSAPTSTRCRKPRSATRL
jgi:hypothetical protein